MNNENHVQDPQKASPERLTAAYDEADSRAFRLDEAAAHYFGCEQRVDIAELTELGPVVSSPGQRMPFGKWLAAQMLAQPKRSGFWGLSLADGSWIDAVAIEGGLILFRDGRAQAADGAAPYSALAHRVRNQLNAIQMNAELLEMLTETDGDARIGRAAERVLRNAEGLRQTLDNVQNDAAETLDLVTTLRAELRRRCGYQLAVADIRIPASRSYCTSLLGLLAQWLVFAEGSASGNVRLLVADAGTISIETPGLGSWVRHSLSSMAEWLRGEDVASAPTRVLRVHDLGCGYWRDGLTAGADFGYRPLSP